MRSTSVAMLGVAAALLLAGCDSGSDAAVPDAAGSSDAGPDPTHRDAVAPSSDGEPPPPDGAHTGPEIQVDPLSLRLASQIGVESAPGVVTVHNHGLDPLVLESVEVEAGPSAAQFAARDLPAAFPAEVAPGGRLEIGVTYRPTDDAERQAALVIRSNDSDEGAARVSLLGRIQQSCLRVAPGSLDFGAVDVGVPSGNFRLEVSNCGDVPVSLTDIRLEGDGGFAWAPEGEADPVGAPLAPGDVARLSVWYENDGLAPDERASARLIIESDSAAQPLIEVPLRVRGGGGPSCIVTLEPDRVEIGHLRVGHSRAVEIAVINSGTAQCEVRELAVESDQGPPENTFEITRGLDVQTLEPGSRNVIEVTYTPTLPDPRGDRAALTLDYHDPHRGQNRRATVLIFGQGTEALIGPDPAGLDFGKVTVPVCASWRLRVRAANFGFVPICATGFRFEGEQCPQFAVVEQPEIDVCTSLERDESVDFEFQFEPDELGVLSCRLVVTSDAMNTQAMEIPLRGEGVDSPATRDEHVVGRLTADRRAHWRLSRPAVAASIRVFVDDEPNEAWGFEARSNSIFFDPDDHPARGDALRIEYDADCLERL